MAVTQMHKRRRMLAQVEDDEDEEASPASADAALMLEDQRCALCKIGGFPRASGPLLGPFVYGDFQCFVHENCALYSKNVSHQSTETEGSRGACADPPELDDSTLLQEIRRAAVTVCTKCRAFNATVNCAGEDCPNVFHFPCIWTAQCKIREFNVYCSECSMPKSDEAEKASSDGNASDNDSDDDDVYVVEKIIQRRKIPNGGCEYEVKWAGYDETTWEPSRNIIDKTMLRSFNLALNVSSVTGDTGKDFILTLDPNNAIPSQIFDPNGPRPIGNIWMSRGLPDMHVSLDTPDGQIPVNVRPKDGVIPEFLVQFKYASHCHNQWMTEQQLLKHPGGVEKLRAYHKRRNSGHKEKEVKESFCVVDRIVASEPVLGPEGFVRVVKWCDLPYEECTREYESTLQNVPGYQEALARYTRANTLPELRPPRAGEVRSEASNFVPLKKHPEHLQHKHQLQLQADELQATNDMLERWHDGQPFIFVRQPMVPKINLIVAFLTTVTVRYCRQPALVVVEKSAECTELYSQLLKWAPTANVIKYTGSIPFRTLVRNHELFFRKNTPAQDNRAKFDVMVTTTAYYEAEFEHFADVEWTTFMIVCSALRAGKPAKKGQVPSLPAKALKAHALHRCLVTEAGFLNIPVTKELLWLKDFLLPDATDLATDGIHGRLRDLQLPDVQS